MKTKIILALIGLTVLGGISAFKSISSENDSRVATVVFKLAKNNMDFFFISYGDGKTEQVLIDYKSNVPSEMHMEVQAKFAFMANQLAQKGYHFSGSSANPYYNIFEK